jgi:hypothetical protein
MKSPAAPSARYARNPEVVTHEEDEDGALVFNPDNDRIKVLNRTGAFVWGLCDGTRAVKGIVSALLDAFEGVPKRTVATEVKTYIDELVKDGFIHPVSDDTA